MNAISITDPAAVLVAIEIDAIYGETRYELSVPPTADWLLSIRAEAAAAEDGREPSDDFIWCDATPNNMQRLLPKWEVGFSAAGATWGERRSAALAHSGSNIPHRQPLWSALDGQRLGLYENLSKLTGRYIGEGLGKGGIPGGGIVYGSRCNGTYLSSLLSHKFH